MRGILRLAVSAAGCLTLVLCAPILLIRMRPYDAGMVELLLPAAECAPPCFMGLRPGESTLNEAIRFFEQRPNVRFVVQRPVDFNISDDTAILYWREDGSPISGSMNFDDGQLMETMVQGLRLYEIWLTLGEPDSAQMAMELVYLDNSTIFSRPTAHIGYYNRQRIRVHVPSTCLDFWQQLSYVLIGNTVVPAAAAGGPTLPNQRQIACEQERAWMRLIHED